MNRSEQKSVQKVSGKKAVPPIAAYAKWGRRCFQHQGSEVWNVKLQYQGRRETFGLATANRSEAGVRARGIYMALRTLGWPETLAKYKPAGLLPAGNITTVGQFLAAVEKVFTGQKNSFQACAASFRRLAADIAGIDRKAPGWRMRADSISLGLITRPAIETWRTGYLSRFSGDLERLRSARTSSNSFIRQSKALFSAERLELVGLSESPFAKVKFLPALDHRFRGGPDAQALMRSALSEFASEPELLKAFLLALCCGLRRGEIDRVEWSAFNFDAGFLHVGATRFLRPKSEKSIGDIDLDPELVAIFRGFRARATGNFVIESDVTPKLGAGYSHYRCETLFKRLTAWLRDHGVRNRTPVHSLRKLFGSMINDRFGLHSASLALRHADIGITSQHYVSKRSRVTVGLGDVLAEQKKVAKIDLHKTA